MTTQHALRYLDGLIVTYPDGDAARAAQERMRRWPTTKYTDLLVRVVQYGEWELVG